MSIPEGATHKAVGPRIDCWYKNINCLGFEFMNQGGSEWIKRDGIPNWPYERIANEQPKQWSGPEDGLPPVGTVCEVYDEDEGEWVVGKVVYLGVNAGSAICVTQGEHDLMYGYGNDDIRKPRTQEQIANDKRETAIRELMDIAQVDCRVTAARLVDAGFKR